MEEETTAPIIQPYQPQQEEATIEPNQQAQEEQPPQEAATTPQYFNIGDTPATTPILATAPVAMQPQAASSSASASAEAKQSLMAAKGTRLQ